MCNLKMSLLHYFYYELNRPDQRFICIWSQKADLIYTITFMPYLFYLGFKTTLEYQCIYVYCLSSAFMTFIVQLGNDI